jgi:hypothetical protein
MGNSIFMDEKYREIDPGLPERLGGNLKTMKQVYDSTFTLLRGKNLSETAVKCGASFEEDGNFVLKYFEKKVVMDIETGKLYYREDKKDLDIFSATIILHYIVTADGEALSGKWISYRELPDGMFYFRTIPGVLELLLKKYGDSFELLAEKARMLGGKISNDFKNGVILFPFPYFPVMLILEEKSEEFDADLRALFDSSASHYMKTDIVKVLLVNIVKLMTS